MPGDRFAEAGHPALDFEHQLVVRAGRAEHVIHRARDFAPLRPFLEGSFRVLNTPGRRRALPMEAIEEPDHLASGLESGVEEAGANQGLERIRLDRGEGCDAGRGAQKRRYPVFPCDFT